VGLVTSTFGRASQQNRSQVRELIYQDSNVILFNAKRVSLKAVKRKILFGRDYSQAKGRGNWG